MADRANSIFLANDALVKFGFHVEQLGGFFFGEFVHRDTCPEAQNLSNSFFVDLIEKINTRSLDVGFFVGAFFKK